MMKLTLALLAVALVLVSCQKSPRSEVFQDIHVWNTCEVNLPMSSEYTLYGIWIRLTFNEPIKGLVVNVS